MIEKTPETTSSFGDRKNFVAFGNLLHAPNVDAVLQLKELWPAIKEQLPQVELHVYGAYAPQQILQLHNEREGFLVKGWIEDLKPTLEKYRLQLAYLRFGAGLKGKLVDALRFGLPSITTEIGGEGLNGELNFGGKITSSKEDFVTAAVEFYTRENLWSAAQKNGFEIIEHRFQKHIFSNGFKERIDFLVQNLEQHRQRNFMGQVLQHQSLQASKYLSKWIEAKNTTTSSSVCYANSNEVREEYR